MSRNWHAELLSQLKIKIMKKKLILALLLIIPTLIFSQNINKNSLNDYFNQLESNNKWMGSVTISSNKKIIYEKSIGFSDIDEKTKNSKNTKYRIGSISKMFTAVLILKAIEENKIQLNENIETFFKEATFSKNVTIKHLLSHQSGIGNFLAYEIFNDWKIEKKSESEMLKIISNSGKDFEPGSNVKYSNSNYYILSLILEKLYNKDFSQIVKEKLIIPLKLKNTYVDKVSSFKENETRSYYFKNQQWVRDSETNMSIALGSGNVISTTSDLNLFLFALFTEKIINSKSIAQMKTFDKKLGLGLMDLSFKNIDIIGHTGGIDCFSSICSYISSKNAIITICSNANNTNNKLIFEALMKGLNNEPIEFQIENVIKVTSAELDKFLGTYKSEQVPFKLIFTKSKDILQMQATGQPIVDIEYKGGNEFIYQKRNMIFNFNLGEKKLNVKMGQREATFVKE